MKLGLLLFIFGSLLAVGGVILILSASESQMTSIGGIGAAILGGGTAIGGLVIMFVKK